MWPPAVVRGAELDLRSVAKHSISAMPLVDVIVAVVAAVTQTATMLSESVGATTGNGAENGIGSIS